MTIAPEERSKRPALGHAARSAWVKPELLRSPLTQPPEMPSPILPRAARRRAVQLAQPPVLPVMLLRPRTSPATPLTPPPMPRRPRPPAPRQVVQVALGSNEKRPILDFPGERPTM